MTSGPLLVCSTCLHLYLKEWRPLVVVLTYGITSSLDPRRLRSVLKTVFILLYRYHCINI